MRPHRGHDFIRVHLFQIGEHLQIIGDIQHIIPRQQMLLHQLQLL